MSIETLFNRRSQKKRTSLEISESLCKAFGDPQKSFPTIHVAGTNGKGQVSAKIAVALESAGYKVGLYTSPHLFAFEERITINGVKIPRSVVFEKEGEVILAAEKLEIEPNFFEYATIFAWTYFREQKVDVAVIETGLGGRLDATNVITPILSIITSVGYDHQDFLGESLKEIAHEKAGIIKEGQPVVVGPRANMYQIVERTRALHAPLIQVEKPERFYEENSLIAKAALDLLKQPFSLDENALEKGLKKTLPCRFERKGNVISDVAHNIDGFAYLRDLLDHFYPEKTFRFVIGMSKGKSPYECFRSISSKVSAVHFVQADNPVAATPKELGEVFRKISSSPIFLEESVASGIEKAKAATKPEDMMVICGSFYIMNTGFMPGEQENGPDHGNETRQHELSLEESK